MSFIRDLARLGLILCGVSLFSGYEGRPVTRRAVSEMQLMHSFGDFQHSLQRQEWLQMRLHNLSPASASTPQEAALKPQRPRKKEKPGENRTKNAARHNQRASGKRPQRHGAKPNIQNYVRPDIQ